MSKMFIKFFTIADYEEEEEWLKSQHRKGFKFIDMKLPCFYFFEETKPADVIYRLDYQNKTPDADYKQMYADFGWEYITKCTGWNYLRKSCDEITDAEDTEIFSDNESRIAMIQKVICTRMLPILAIFLCCIIPQLHHSLEDSFHIGYAAALSVLTLFYIYLIAHCTSKLVRLKRKWDK